MADDPALLSSLVPYGYQANSCGYCGSRAAGRKTSPAYYASSSDVLPEHYQALADHGWRRSGDTYYKPDLKNSCCPHYTIRLDASAVQPARDQRRAVNRFNEYIRGLDYRKAAARLVPKSRAEKKLRRSVWDIDSVTHEAEYSHLARPIDPKSGIALEPAHTLHITLEPDSFTEEKYDLFENYQRIVHREPRNKISKSSFRSFLCSGFPQTRTRIPSVSATSSVHEIPVNAPEAENGSGKRLGSYHHCYRVDGKLIALGVLDLLPDTVSSVYLIYHESVSAWEFGKISAMNEIALARKGGYKYYYMGYYIHSCAKMKYKMEYKPQYVLDPLDYSWHLADGDLWDSLSKAKFVAYTDGKWRPHIDAPTTIGSATGHGEKIVSGKDIWSAGMLGVMSPDAIANEILLDDVRAVAGEVAFPLSVLFGDGWDPAKIQSSSSIQNLCAEFIACIGKDMLPKIAMQLEPYIRQ